MKKTYYFITAIFFVLLYFCIFSCSTESNFFEDVTFILPQWPPENSEAINYPDLDYWFIKIEGSDISQELCTNSDSLTLKLPKNIPCSITTAPVTKNMMFFLPAGTIYPYYLNCSYKSLTQKLTWEGGFSAELMQSIYKSRLETEISATHMQNFQKSFNWKKCQDSIENKIQEESDIFYNPWQIDTQTLLNNLCTGNFSSAYLNTKNIYSINLESIDFPQTNFILSSYIPENTFIQTTKILTLQKDKTQLYIYDQKYGLQITCSSSKKVSVAYTYLPILYKSYETLYTH